MLPFTPVFINGSEISNPSQTFEVISPVTLKAVGTAASASLEDCLSAIKAADEAFKSWSQTHLSQRRDIFFRAAELLDTQEKWKKEIVESMVEETGASIEIAMFNYLSAAVYLKATASNIAVEMRGERFVSESRITTPETILWTEKTPYGVIFTQSPWNAPVALTLRSVVTPILCGNTVVFRPSELSPRSCAIVYNLLKEAGLPGGVFNYIPISREDTPKLTAEIIADKRVRKITFTGSDRVGRIIAMEAAKHLKPCILELGGKAPAIVLSDAHISSAAKHIVSGSMLHSGQICMSTERVIVQSDAAAKLKEEILRFANELQEKDKLGPLFSQAHADGFVDLLKDAQNWGAEVLLGDLTQKDRRVQPHVVIMRQEDVKEGKAPKLWEKESFGPALILTVVNTVEEAIDLANASDYSLTSSVWTSDLYKAHQVAAKIRAGYTNINGSTIHSEPNMGLIGIGGTSGYGRFGVDDFTYKKTVVVHPLGAPSVFFG